MPFSSTVKLWLLFFTYKIHIADTQECELEADFHREHRKGFHSMPTQGMNWNNGLARLRHTDGAGALTPASQQPEALLQKLES